jgi:hypothetical protein
LYENSEDVEDLNLSLPEESEEIFIDEDEPTD